MQFEMDEQFIKQKALMAAENIVCAVRGNGWDSLDYATRLIEQCMKDASQQVIQKALIKSGEKETA